MTRASYYSLGLAALLGVLVACGSETPSAPTPPPAPAATASPAPTAVPTPRPTATPEPTLTGEEVYPGPVKSVKVRLYAVVAPNGQYRPEPFYDPRSDTDVAYNGDFIVLDVTPRNAAGQKCEGETDPRWIFEGGGNLLRARASSNPYLYRADTVGTGTVYIRAIVDGIVSNLIRVEIR
jgi:hypothetical protein